MSDAALFNMQDLAGASTPGTATTHSLYRKYRPTSFADDDLVGQEHVVNTLRNAIALNRISHAYLFCGPRGTGKTTTARLMAKAVNCLDPDPHARPCNSCTACVAINTNATTDVIEIDAASNRGIDDIRDLRERVKYAPAQLSTKFYIIDEAHQITGAAANAFLKTLEEPPPHTRFILATTDPEELLPTIVSRCQRFDFRRISLDASVARLRTVAEREGIAIDDDALPIIARQATGSLRDALGMLDQLAVYRESGDDDASSISAEMVRAVLGVSRNERIERLMTAIADRDAATGLQEINAAVEAGDDIRQLGRQLVTYVRMLMLQKAGGSSEADDTARSLADRFRLDELASLMRQIADIDFRAKRATYPQLPLELAIVDATQGDARSQPETRSVARDAPPLPVADDRPIDDDILATPSEPRAPRPSLKDRVRGTASASVSTASRRPEPAPPVAREIREALPSAAPVPATPARTESPSAGSNGSLSLPGLVELWPKIRNDVKAVNRRIEALLQQVGPAAVNGSQVVLESPYEFHRNRVNSDEVRNVVEDVLTRLLGQKVTVTCVSHEEGLRLASAAAPGAAGPVATVTASTPPPAPAPTDPGDSSLIDLVDAEGPSPEQQEADERRITAARNIFDADEIID
jgi:DNA polymerase-3 subunit gamma/tau